MRVEALVSRTTTEEVAAAVLESVGCPMGCNAADEAVATGRDRLHGLPGTFRVVRCGRCGLIRTSPRPTIQTIGAYYPEAYGPYAARANEGKETHGFFARLAVALRLDGTRQLVPRMRPGAALEIGCSTGDFMRKLRRRGWHVEGIEPSAQAAGRARAAGFNVHTGPLETAPEPDRPFDLITASHALEHLHDPLEAMRRLRAWAKPGAWLTCAVPNAGSWLFSQFRDAWYDIDLPRHLFHFTPETLSAMLGRAGWRVVRVRTQPTLNGLMGSLGYRLEDRSAGRSGIAEALLRFPESPSVLKKFTLPLWFFLLASGQTGRMVVWARADQPM